jgi:hypothetical protein
MSSWAAVVTKKGQKHDATTKTGSASTTPRPAAMMVARDHCLALKTASIPSPDALAKALASQYPELESQIVPLLIDGQILLQLKPEADPAKILAEGLMLGSIRTMAVKLFNSCSHSNILQCQVSGFLADEFGCAAIKAALSPAKIITWELEYYTGTKVKKGIANFLLDISDSSKIPAKILRIDRGSWTEMINFRVLGRHLFCHYCRETSHARLDCPHAPACSTCGGRGHPTQRCTSQNSKVPKKTIPRKDPNNSDSSKEVPGTEAEKEKVGDPKRHRSEAAGQETSQSTLSTGNASGNEVDSSSQAGTVAIQTGRKAGQGSSKRQRTGEPTSGAQVRSQAVPNAQAGSLLGNANATDIPASVAYQQQQAAIKAAAHAKITAKVKEAAKQVSLLHSCQAPDGAPFDPIVGPAPEQSDGMDHDGDVVICGDETSPSASP